MRDDLPRFPTPSEAFGRKAQPGAEESGGLAKPPAQRFRGAPGTPEMPAQGYTRGDTRTPSGGAQPRRAYEDTNHKPQRKMVPTYPAAQMSQMSIQPGAPHKMVPQLSQPPMQPMQQAQMQPMQQAQMQPMQQVPMQQVPMQQRPQRVGPPQQQQFAYSQQYVADNGGAYGQGDLQAGARPASQPQPVPVQGAQPYLAQQPGAQPYQIQPGPMAQAPYGGNYAPQYAGGYQAYDAGGGAGGGGVGGLPNPAYAHPVSSSAPSSPGLPKSMTPVQSASASASSVPHARTPVSGRSEGTDAQGSALKDLRTLFDEVDRKKRGYLTERELAKALVNSDYTLFDAHTVRLMMKMFDRDGDGAIYFAEFGQLWKYLHEWRLVFGKFDTNKNQSIGLDEFSRALAAFGYSLSESCVQFMFNAGSKLNRQGERQMAFDMFVQSCISIKSITDTFKRYDSDRDGYVTMAFEDFLIETTKLH